MARYRGKREAPPAERAHRMRKTELEELGDPFAQEAGESGGDFVQEDPSPLGDPFAGEEEEKKPGGFGAALGRFFHSKKGKIITAVVCCVLAFAVGGVIALRSWIKPPELPTLPSQSQPHLPIGGDDAPVEPEGPTDEELYPDDGYNGDMPTVSGDRKEGVYTFLLVGTDKDDGNTDTIMVVSYDTVNQDINIMSIPRDTMINASWDIKKINSVYSRYSDGIGALKKRVKNLIGFQPDFYVKVDLSMFVELVDLIGGVEFDVPQDMDYEDQWQDLYIHLKKGVQVLDGDKAMQLVRFRRYAEGDIKRVEVQQNFMKALIKECLSFGNWGKIKAYIDLGLENVQTDLDFGSVVWFAANVLGLNGTPALNMDDVYTCTLPGNYYASAWSRDTNQSQSYVTIYPNQVVNLVNERFNPYQQKVTTGMLDAMSILSNGDIASSTGNLADTKHNAIMAVQRGEAYYDDDGKLVYGKRPQAAEGVQIDEMGNYYILDENGTIIYTDENGTPLEGLSSEPNGSDSPTVPSGNTGTATPVTPSTGTDGPDTGNGPEEDPTAGNGEPTLPPSEPGLPPEEPTAEPEPEPDSSVDTEPPGWLLP